MTRLPLAEEHESDYAQCAYCPKLCKFSCPTGTVSGNESESPWGMMTSAHHGARGALEIDASYARAWEACTGCGRCASFCKHKTPVAAAVRAVRKSARQAGLSSAALDDVVARQPAREQALLERAAKLFPTRRPKAKVAFVPGCTSVSVSGDDAVLGMKVVERLTGKEVHVVAQRCCGRPYLDAGATDAFEQNARVFAAELSQCEEVIFLDPGCMNTLGSLAAEAPRARLRHISELAAAHLELLHEIDAPGATYRDPCELGRGLGIYDAPRNVLAKLLGRPVAERFHKRETAECSGAGGQLPRTRPALADSIARERLAELNSPEESVRIAVEACPGAAHRMRSASDTVEVRSFVSLLAEGLDLL